MSEKNRKSFPAEPGSASRLECAAATGAIGVLNPLSSASSKARSFDVNEESVQAAGVLEKIGDGFAQARATEDDALRSQMCGVRPRTASSEGRPESNSAEHVVLSETSAVRGDISEAAATEVHPAVGSCAACGGPACASGFAKAAPLPSGSGSSIPSPAGGLRVVGLSFIGLLGLDHALRM